MYTSGKAKRPPVARRLFIAIGMLALLSYGVGWFGQVALSQSWFDAIDRMVDSSGASSGVTDFFMLVSQLGSRMGIIVLTILMFVVLLLRRLYWQSVIFLGTAIAGVICQSLLKDWIGRVRPGDLGLMESGSFPSGQAFLSVVIYGLFAIFWARSMRSAAARVGVAVVTLIAITLISYGRIVLGAHYVSDVIAGNVLGLVWLRIVLWGSKRPTRLVYDFS